MHLSLLRPRQSLPRLMQSSFCLSWCPFRVRIRTPAFEYETEWLRYSWPRAAVPRGGPHPTLPRTRGRVGWDEPGHTSECRGSALMRAGGSAPRNSRTLHDDAERCKGDEQNRQQQEHVGKAHHGRLTPGHQGHLLERHGRSVAAEVMKARGEACKHLGRRTARPAYRVVQPCQVQIHAVIDDGVERPKPDAPPHLPGQLPQTGALF